MEIALGWVSIHPPKSFGLLDQRPSQRYQLFKIDSIRSSSSSLNFRLFNEARLTSSCFTLLAPIRAEVTAGFLKTQAIAICARDCPRSCASSLSFCTLGRLALTSSGVSQTRSVFVARAPEGIPFR